MLLLTQNDINEVVSMVGADALMTAIIAKLDEGLRRAQEGVTDLSPARDGFHRAAPAPGVIEWMPHRVSGNSTTIKTVSYSPANPERFGLPTIMAGIARFDDLTGRMTVLADGSTITAIRTGAASAIASRVLAKPDSSVVGIIGCGAQAVTQLHALQLIFPLDVVLAWDVNQHHLDSIADRVAFTGLKVSPTPAEEIVQLADIIVTATSAGIGAGPVLPDGNVKGHLHINAVGSDLAGKTELPLSLLERALVCPDHPEQALREGESQVLQRHQIGPALGQICADPAIVPAAQSRLTVFDSTGMAIEDHLALDVFLGFAAQLGLGEEIPLDGTGADPLNPYSCSSRRAGKQKMSA